MYDDSFSVELNLVLRTSVDKKWPFVHIWTLLVRYRKESSLLLKACGEFSKTKHLTTPKRFCFSVNKRLGSLINWCFITSRTKSLSGTSFEQLFLLKCHFINITLIIYMQIMFYYAREKKKKSGWAHENFRFWIESASVSLPGLPCYTQSWSGSQLVH